MIYVIGDSHSRSFANNANFLPLFIGPGKENCFISKQTQENIKKNTKRALEKIPENSNVLLVLGEPDTRYFLGKGWTPWLIEGDEVVTDVELKIESSFQRYQEIIEWMRKTFNHNFMVFNVIPTIRKKQNAYVKAFNNLLREKLGSRNVLFVDIEERLFSDDLQVHQEYVADEVHLNDLIQPHVEEFLIEHGLVKVSQYKKSDTDYDSKAIQNSFVFNKRFSCYVYDDTSEAMKNGFFNKIIKIFNRGKAGGPT